MIVANSIEEIKGVNPNCMKGVTAMKDQTHKHQISGAELFQYRWRDIFAKKFLMFHAVLVTADE
jgi:hypothetical protein